MIMADLFKWVLGILAFLITLAGHWVLFEALFAGVVKRASLRCGTLPVRTTLLGLLVTVPVAAVGVGLIGAPGAPGKFLGFTGGGWLARYLRATTATPGPLDSVAIAKTLPDVLRGAPASVVMETFDTLAFGPDASAFTGTLGAMYTRDPSALGAAGRDMLAAMQKIREMARSDYRPEGGAEYGSDPFSEGLTRTAQLVKAGLGVRAVSLDLPGWDSHFAQGTLFTPLASQLATGLAAFRRDLGPLMDRVTVVVMSEFGRRVYENASLGTDHGRGGVMLAMGGGVGGGRVIHQWNGLAADRLEGPGDVPVVHDYRDVLTPVLLRHAPGVALEQVFPGHASRPLDLC